MAWCLAALLSFPSRPEAGVREACHPKGGFVLGEKAAVADASERYPHFGRPIRKILIVKVVRYLYAADIYIELTRNVITIAPGLTAFPFHHDQSLSYFGRPNLGSDTERRGLRQRFQDGRESFAV